jgi:hypothetical protein
MMNTRSSFLLMALALFSAVLATNVHAAEPDEGPQVVVYGFVQTDVIYDFNVVDPSWNATLRPSKIPVNCTGATTDPGCGMKNGNTIFSVRQSRLGVKSTLNTELGELNTRFEFDLYGVGADAGQTTIRLRHAYGELGAFLIGQTNSLFMDGDVFPNTIDYWGPNGMIFFRNLQVRWTPWRQDGMKVAVALEGPGAAVDAGNVNNPEGWTSWNHYPDLTGQFRVDKPWGHVQVAAIFRWLGFENPTIPTGVQSGHAIGGGGNLSGTFNTIGRDQLLAQVAYGNGIASYMNDCCVDVAPNNSLTNGQAVPLLGWLLYYDHYWSDRFSSSAGFSMTYQKTTGGQLPTDFQQGYYSSGNLLWYPARNIMTGAELLWGEREDKDGNSSHDTRVQFSAKYSF